jgi:V8-like Glu-specific endopeptidase
MTVWRRWMAGLAGMVAALGLASGAAAAPNGGNSDEARAEHQRIVDFWTAERVAQAVPRDFAFNPDTGRFVPMAKPSKPGSTLEPIWPVGTAVETTGKVLFQMGTSYYVCSASVVQDNNTRDRSVVLTAAHCVYDETAGGFATNWMFIPSYDDQDPDLTTDKSFCTGTDYGCWTATALVVDNEYATAGGFNTQATQHDFAFAVLGAGGKGMTQLDATVGSQAITYNTVTLGSTTYAMGFPQASPYDGDDLRYCDGGLGTDLLNGNATYRVECGMTGGSSGGPWFNPFTSTTGEGTMMSVNSYGYTRNVRTTPYDDSKMMFGPKFNVETEALFNKALTADGNTKV